LTEPAPQPPPQPPTAPPAVETPSRAPTGAPTELESLLRSRPQAPAPAAPQPTSNSRIRAAVLDAQEALRAQPQQYSAIVRSLFAELLRLGMRQVDAERLVVTELPPPR
jgi:hypothetical protein